MASSIQHHWLHILQLRTGVIWKRPGDAPLWETVRPGRFWCVRDASRRVSENPGGGGVRGPPEANENLQIPSLNLHVKCIHYLIYAHPIFSQDLINKAPKQNMMEEEQAKSEGEESTPSWKKKKRQHIQRYMPDYEQTYPCFRKSSIGMTYAFCTICGQDISVSHCGVGDLKNMWVLRSLSFSQSVHE